MFTQTEETAGTPVYMRLRKLFADRIASGVFRPGERIMPENELADEFRVSRTTIRRALAGLEREGFILRFPGKGTFINRTTADARKQLVIGIDFFANFDSSDFHGPVARGILDEAERDGVSVRVMRHEEYAPEKGDRLDGVILMHAPESGSTLFRAISKGLVPAVCFNRAINKNVGFVGIDNFAEAVRGTEFLIRQGHTRIGFYGSGPRTPASAARFEGWRAAMNEAGLEAKKERIHFFEQSGGRYLQAERYFEKTDVTALFVSLAPVISSVFAAMNKYGFSTEDIRIVCFDDLAAVQFDWPGVAYIRMPLYEMGRRMFDALRQKIILGERAPEIKEIFKSEIIYNNNNRVKEKNK